MEEALKEEQPKTFTDYLRKVFKHILDPVAGWLVKIGLHPNVVTVIGLIGHFAAAVLIVFGRVPLGGLVTLIMAPIDAVDGTMARIRGEPTAFGAFVDSVTDRYSEILLFGSLLIYFGIQENFTGVILAFLAVTGSMMVSYARTKAESLGFDSKIGLLSRVERYLILIPCLIFNIPIVALWVLAIFTHITALQRVFYVRKKFYDRMNKGK